MSTLVETNNIRSVDVIDKLIFEKKMRINTVFILKDLDLMIVVLNNKKVLNIQLSEYPKLKNATKNQLDNWKLISKGVGIEWEEIDEDLSLKGFIQTYAYQTALQTIQDKEYIFS